MARKGRKKEEEKGKQKACTAGREEQAERRGEAGGERLYLLLCMPVDMTVAWALPPNCGSLLICWWSPSLCLYVPLYPSSAAVRLGNNVMEVVIPNLCGGWAKTQEALCLYPSLLQ